MRRVDALASTLLVASGLAVGGCGTYAYIFTFRGTWAPLVTIVIAVAHTAFGLMAIPSFQARRAALTVVCLIGLSATTTLIFMVAAFSRFARSQAVDYLRENWAKVQNAAIPFTTLHQQQVQASNALDSVAIAAGIGGAVSAAALAAVWWSIHVRFYRRALTYAVAVSALTSATTSLAFLPSAAATLPFAFAQPWAAAAFVPTASLQLATALLALLLPVLASRRILLPAYRVLGPVAFAVAVTTVAIVASAVGWRNGPNAVDNNPAVWAVLRLYLPARRASGSAADLAHAADSTLGALGTASTCGAIAVAALGFLLGLQARTEDSMDPYIPFAVWMRHQRKERRAKRRLLRHALAHTPADSISIATTDYTYIRDGSDFDAGSTTTATTSFTPTPHAAGLVPHASSSSSVSRRAHTPAPRRPPHPNAPPVSDGLHRMQEQVRLLASPGQAHAGAAAPASSSSLLRAASAPGRRPALAPPPASAAGYGTAAPPSAATDGAADGGDVDDIGGRGGSGGGLYPADGRPPLPVAAGGAGLATGPEGESVSRRVSLTGEPSPFAAGAARAGPAAGGAPPLRIGSDLARWEGANFKEPDRCLDVLLGRSRHWDCCARWLVVGACSVLLLGILAAIGVGTAVAAAKGACADYNALESVSDGLPPVSLATLGYRAQLDLALHTAGGELRVRVSDDPAGKDVAVNATAHIRRDAPTGWPAAFLRSAVSLTGSRFHGELAAPSARSLFGADQACAAVELTAVLPKGSFDVPVNATATRGAHITITGPSPFTDPNAFPPLGSVNASAATGLVHADGLFGNGAVTLSADDGDVWARNIMGTSVLVRSAGGGRTDLINATGVTVFLHPHVGPITVESGADGVWLTGLFGAGNVTVTAHGGGDVVFSNAGLVYEAACDISAVGGGSVFLNYVDALAGALQTLRTEAGGKVTAAVLFANRLHIDAAGGGDITVVSAFLGTGKPNDHVPYPPPGLVATAHGRGAVNLYSVSGANATFSKSLDISATAENGAIVAELGEAGFMGSFRLEAPEGTAFASVGGSPAHCASRHQCSGSVTAAGGSVLFARSEKNDVELAAPLPPIPIA